MVLEQIFKASWLEKRPMHAFLLGIIYTIIGIISARVIFPSNTGLMTVAFTSILLILSLNKLLQDEENVEIREDKFSFRMLIKDHRDIFEIYFFLFIGVLLAYAAVSLILPEGTVLKMFSTQLKVAGITGHAIFNSEVMSIMLNNILVFVVCFILSLIYGAGSIIFLVWNASVWGSVFGFVAKSSAGSMHPFLSFGLVMLPVLAHMITEALSYFFAAVVGGVVSKAVMREDLFSKKFHHILTDALMLMLIGFILVVIAAIIEVHLTQSFAIVVLLGLVLLIAIIVGAIYPTDILEKE